MGNTVSFAGESRHEKSRASGTAEYAALPARAEIGKSRHISVQMANTAMLPNRKESARWI